MGGTLLSDPVPSPTRARDARTGHHRGARASAPLDRARRAPPHADAPDVQRSAREHDQGVQGGLREGQPARRPRDPELDRQGHERVLWGQHSWRRLGEKVARDSKPIWEAEGVTSTDVDKYSDWNQMELSKDMQIHYSGEQRSFRVRRCAITRSM